MNFDQLKAFEQVVKSKSFSAAAVSLNISQSALSKQIKRLEAELDIQLIDRHNRRRVIITDAGESLARYVATILTQQQLLLNEVGGYQTLQRGKIRIAAVPVMAQYGLTARLAAFLRKYPQIDVDLEEAENDQVLQQLTAGERDLAIVRDTQLPANFKRVDVLAEDELVAVVPKRSLWADNKRLAINQLRTASFVTLPADSGVQQPILDLCQAAGFTPNIHFVSSHIETVIAMVRDAQQVAILFRRAAQPFLDDQVQLVPLKQTLHSQLLLVLPEGHVKAPVKQLRRMLLK
ncbi:LysR family transcriptional regulator [Loigolactobacillus iwatensis]|uniref:LysR family transcriptional regulator n=1 Tax=Loigolactobacillus iwatensis TaxID=1267156 RepID=UPI000F7E11BD|nr:LysR family transcriptional regulator [Loigolactobacillus iwatensis]